MKNRLLLFCSLAVLTAFAATSCQKEQRTVTLGLSLEQDAKLVIDEYNYPCWSSGDQVWVNTGTYTVSNISTNGRTAQIADVTESQDGYWVLYPASLMTTGRTSTVRNSSTGEVEIYLPNDQSYAVDGNGRQKVTLPMGGIDNSTNMTLHNLGSILRVNVTNSLGHSVTLSHITVTADNDFLSGYGTATINGTDEDKIVASLDHLMSLDIQNGATIAACSTRVFSIWLPTFSTGSQITVRVTTDEGGYKDFPTTSTDITLASNQIVNFSADLTGYTGYGEAYLKDGSDIHDAIEAAIADNSNITAVSFVCDATTVTSGTPLKSGSTLTPIYGNVVFDEDNQTYTYVISTPSSVMNARDCNEMFQGLSSLTSITFGTGFNTAGAGSMASMFEGCSNLTSLDLSSFNTEGVDHMSSMFSGCTHISSLNLSNFVISDYCDLNEMCIGLATATVADDNGYNCTITCTTDVKTRLQSGTDLPSEDWVHFNWVTPPSGDD